MIPDQVKQKLQEINTQIEELEDRLSHLNREALQIIESFSRTVTDLNYLLDLTPPGYVRFRIRQRLDNIEADLDE